MTVSLMTEDSVKTVTDSENLKWDLLLALPSASLSTGKARALLPDRYSREDAVANIQATALLVSAFAFHRGDLLASAMRDHIHQPYRMEACPLLPRLLPLAGTQDMLGVALSGAGPSVLLIVEKVSPAILAAIRNAAQDPDVEIIQTSIAGGVEFQNGKFLL
jgi:homoserine kinase